MVFTLNTTNVDAGSVYSYVLSGVSASDVVGGALTGTTTVGADGKAVVAVQLAADATTEGVENMTMTLAGQTASVSVADTSLTPPPPAPEPIALTTDLDNKVGTAGNDTFTGGFTTAATFNSGDTIDGGAGTDTLSITVGAATTYTLANVSNVESIKGNFTAAGTLSLLGSTGVTSVESNASTAAAVFTNISSTTVGLKETGNTTATTFTFTDAAVEGTSDSATLTVSGVSKATTVATTIAGVETLNIVAATDSTLGLLTATSARTINVSGAGALTIVDNLATATTFNAASNTGGVDVDFGVGAVTATGGTGNDTFSFEAAGNVSATGGAGNDTFSFVGAGTLTTADTVVGGLGTDKLSVDTSADLEGYAAPTTATISGIEVLEFQSALAASFTTANIQAGIETVELDAGTGAATITMDAGTRNVKIGALNTGLLTVADTGSATNDVLNITNTSSTGADVIGATGLTSTGFETLNVSSTPVTGTTTLTLGAVTVTPDAGGTGVLNISGTNQVTATTITADKLDVSGLTAAASGSTFVMTASSGIETIIGSAGNDTLVGDADGVTISAGAGRDNVTGGAGNDTVLGGDGNDTISAAAGNDSISGEAGNDSITAGSGNDTVLGGDGNDTLVFGDDLATGDSVDGGAGTDTLSVTDAALNTISGYSITAATALNAAISNVEKVTVSDRLNRGTFDIGRLDGIQDITLAAGINGNEALTGLNSGASITILGASAAASDELTLTQSTDGSADSFTINLTNDNNTDFAEVTLVDVETLNIVTAQATAAAALVTASFDVNASGNNNTTALTTLNVSGTENLDLSGTAINVLTVNATGLTTSLGGTAAGLNFLGGNAAQTINLGAGADTIDAGGGADTINAGGGADTIVGGSGNDVINGESGNDSITGGADNDTLTGGEGADTLVGSAGNDSIILTETTSVADVVVINATHNVSSDSARATVAGNDNDTGSDTITGFTWGTDVIRVVGTDVVGFVHGTGTTIGTAVGDVNDGSAGSFLTSVGLINLDNITATFADTGDIAINFASSSAALTEARFEAALQYNISGSAAANTITTGALADTITGGAGADTLTGGAGADTFVYATGATGITIATADTITDFTTADDSLQVGFAGATAATIADGTLFAAGGDAGLTDFIAAADAILRAGANANDDVYAAWNVAGTGNAYVVVDHNDSGSVDAGDTLIVLTGINLAAEIALANFIA